MNPAMSAYTLKTLDVYEKPAPGPLSSLVFSVPFPDHVPRQISERYEALRTERHMEGESHYEETSGRLALQVYNEESIRADRDRWAEHAASTFRELVQANKSTLRHVELILPTGGIATPLNLFTSMKEIAHLESFCVQWPLSGYCPLTLLFMSQWSQIIEDSITASFVEFHAALIDLLSTHASSLKRLRISLPESTPQKPFSALSLNASSFPTLPALETLDLTHWSPTIADLKTLLAPGGPVPALQHLIIDHGVELPATDFDGHDDGEEVGPDYDFEAAEVETHSWPALGAFLATHPTTLRSLSAALHDARFSYGFAYRLNQRSLREMLRVGAGDSAAVESLVVCTAWPVRYEALEPDGREGEREADLYAHAPGCGHLAYPPDQRPTTGLWPAQGAEARAMQTLAGRPWY
ncbi:hypothetical protein B0H10DRAFT_368241 [Mycena sp. CBHHK59/15]|nr:hypothetical protein B0H10DRAFT_368241 [Mycena sp. CBHHK59/15]